MGCVRRSQTFPGAGPRPSRKSIKKLSLKEKGAVSTPKKRSRLVCLKPYPREKCRRVFGNGVVFSIFQLRLLDGKIILARPRFIFLMGRHPIVILGSFKSSLSAFSTGERRLRGRYGNRARPQPLGLGCAGADGSEPQETEDPPFSL